MKPWLIGIFLGLLGVSAYFVMRPAAPDAPKGPVGPPADHAFLRAEKVDLPYNVSKMDHASKLFGEGRFEEAIKVWADVYRTTHSAETKASAVLLAAEAFIAQNTPESRREAEKLYLLYLAEFPKDPHGDTARYKLGNLALANGDSSTALVYLTAMLEDYPGSMYAASAASEAHDIALKYASQNESVRGRIVARLRPILPSSTPALLSMLTSSFTLIVWFAYDWQNHYKRLFQKKDPVLWGVIVALLLLAGANYIFEDRQEAKSTVEALKALGKIAN